MHLAIMNDVSQNGQNAVFITATSYERYLKPLAIRLFVPEFLRVIIWHYYSQNLLFNESHADRGYD